MLSCLSSFFWRSCTIWSLHILNYDFMFLQEHQLLYQGAWAVEGSKGRCLLVSVKVNLRKDWGWILGQRVPEATIPIIDHSHSLTFCRLTFPVGISLINSQEWSSTRRKQVLSVLMQQPWRSGGVKVRRQHLKAADWCYLFQKLLSSQAFSPVLSKLVVWIAKTCFWYDKKVKIVSRQHRASHGVGRCKRKT